MAKNDIYDEPITIEFPGLVAKVYRPILTKEERERRMRLIARAAADLIISAEKVKNKGECKWTE